MYCNKIEETLFNPLPASLWTDYHRARDHDDDDDDDDDDCDVDSGHFGGGYSSGHRPDSLSSILPPSTPFKSLKMFDEERVNVVSHDEGPRHGRHHNCNDNVNAYEYYSCFGSNDSDGMTVKSLFHDGCLFTYSTPTENESVRSPSSFAKRAAEPNLSTGIVSALGEIFFVATDIPW
eukprot:CAMPEP_0172356262 /NCGR_PEP_ID=MMETSP1060-20121228/641_1 /TAXON_ID=37318 /ORGANISM="Pseudo-nitzschia pungens, Strain cf. cingulata" /LENGTH=176 /DNA_ID=CAMNT_0013076279 /DNA_START=334 /DNA_END=860 /DNA_ORIENTATION=+